MAMLYIPSGLNVCTHTTVCLNFSDIVPVEMGKNPDLNMSSMTLMPAKKWTPAAVTAMTVSLTLLGTTI